MGKPPLLPGALLMVQDVFVGQDIQFRHGLQNLMEGGTISVLGGDFARAVDLGKTTISKWINQG